MVTMEAPYNIENPVVIQLLLLSNKHNSAKVITYNPLLIFKKLRFAIRE